MPVTTFRCNLFPNALQFLKSKMLQVEFVHPRMGRFKRIYIGCKRDTLYWGPYILILLKLTKFNFVFEANDLATDELMAEMQAGWDVILVIFFGAVWGDCLFAVLKSILLMHTDIIVDTPLIHPGPQRALHIIMWLPIAGFYVNGIGGMGVLVDAIREKGIVSG
jgi:hypothetical protein